MADIYVYGYIGEDMGHGSISANQFAWLMQQANGDDVTVHINSGGGDVFAAHAMAETIRAYKGRVVASIEGLAASAASYFALTANMVVMNPSALLMIHNPSGVCMGESADMRKTADMLDTVKETIIGQYERKTKLDKDEIAALMDAETWFSADKAKEQGFVDSITEDEPVTACVSQKVLDTFKNAPEDLKAYQWDGVRDSAANIASDAQEEKAASESDVAAVESISRTMCSDGLFFTY